MRSSCLVLTASLVPCPLPCPLADWQDGLPFCCGERPCGGDGAPPGPRRRPEGRYQSRHQDVPSCPVVRVSRAHRIARALSPSLPPRRVARRPSISLRRTAMWRRWSSSWPTAPTRTPKKRYAHQSELDGWGESREEERVQRCTGTCHERFIGTHQPPAQALCSPRRTQSHKT